MKPRAVVVDTNVIVAGVLTGNSTSPTARVLDAMLEGRFVMLLSTALLTEYRQVLLRPRIRESYGLDDAEVDALLTEIVVNAVIREPASATELAPKSGDQPLWDLLATEAGAVLVSGDQRLVRSPPDGASAISVASFVESLAAI